MIVQLYCSEPERSRLLSAFAPIRQALGLRLGGSRQESKAPALLLLAVSAREQLRGLVAQHSNAPILVLGPDRATIAIDCIRQGASEYVNERLLFDEPDSLTGLISGLLRHQSKAPVMCSNAAAEAYRLARRVAASEVPVFIQGPSGSGKEVLARFVHDHSLRRSGPFVAVNCAAIPENMLEATLFGHEKGAFTGADRSRDGKFVAAAEGTLLLDEVTEMPLELQAKLLRAVQEKEIEPLGARAPVKTNVRIIATSNRDLKQAIDEGRLRLDLYYRLNVFPIVLPKLQDRIEDILPLAELFARRHRAPGQFIANDGSMFDTGAEQALQQHSWPGNVRELENRVQRALILCEAEQMSAEDLGLVKDSTVDGTFRARLDAQEDAMILQALREHEGHRRATASALGMSERTLRYRLSRMRDAGVSI